MLANENLDRDFSLIIPTRDRIDMLKRCLTSFFSNAKRPHNNEAVLIVDLDDKGIRDFADFIIENKFNVRIIQTWQSKMTIRDYNNYGAQCSLGKYIWMLNDDYEMTNKDWDEVIKTRIEEFCQKNNNRIAYVSVDDSTHTEWKIETTHGCCCPILTREAVEAMNGIMPSEINSWGADISLFQIFKRIKEDRILNLNGEIKVLHHCRHNKTATVDGTARRVEQISVKTVLTESEIGVYIDRLNGAI